MIITDLSYLESTSEVIGYIRGGMASAYAGALAQVYSPSGLTFTGTTVKTFAMSTPYVAVAMAFSFAVAIAFEIPSFP